MKLAVAGMTCSHCVRNVTGALQAIDPGARVVVDLQAGTVAVEGDVAPAAARAALEAAGYPVTGVIDASAQSAGRAQAQSGCCGHCQA